MNPISFVREYLFLLLHDLITKKRIPYILNQNNSIYTLHHIYIYIWPRSLNDDLSLNITISLCKHWRKCQRHLANLAAGLMDDMDAHASESINSIKQSPANMKPKQWQKDNVVLVDRFVLYSCIQVNLCVFIWFFTNLIYDSDSESIKYGEKEIQENNAKKPSLQSKERKVVYRLPFSNLSLHMSSI